MQGVSARYWDDLQKASSLNNIVSVLVSYLVKSDKSLFLGNIQ